MAIASGIAVPQVFVMDDRAGDQRLRRGLLAQPGDGGRHPRHARPAQSRRIAGRDRARVQPCPQWRHAPQPAPDGRARRNTAADHAGAHARQLLLAPRQQGLVLRSARFRPDRDRLHRRLLRTADPGERVAPARIPCRCLLGAVHPQPRRHRRRAGENRPSRIARRAIRAPRRRATCSSARRSHRVSAI